ncbi:MAG: hypothetical protein ACW99L_18310 [Promethearchaeota archaeon]
MHEYTYIINSDCTVKLDKYRNPDKEIILPVIIRIFHISYEIIEKIPTCRITYKYCKYSQKYLLGMN